jgi:hypothetical protein
MRQDRFDKVLAFLRRLDEARIHYSLAHVRDDAISVHIAVPGERWEVDFLEDGEVDVERFVSSGTIDDASAWDELFAKFADKDEQVTDNVRTRK